MDLFGSPEPDDDYEEADDAPVIAAEIPEEGNVHPRNARSLLGHEQLEAALLEYYNSGRMPHALIFSGPSGIGKATLAYRLARFLLKHGKTDPNQDSLFGAPETPKSLDISASDPVFSRIASGGHADLLSIERLYDATKDKYKNTVEVDEVRRIAPFLRLTASEGGWRIVIIDDADTMNRNSQNALLKILEEPPQNALLILVTHRAGALLPTIRSRSRRIDFNSLSDETLKTLLDARGHRLSTEEFAMLSGLAQGSLGRALQLIETEGLPMLKQILDLLEARDLVAVHKFADSITAKETGFDLFATLLPSVFAQLARIKARSQKIRGFGVHEPLAAKLLETLSLERLLQTADTLQTHLTRITLSNLDKRQGVLTAFSLIS